MILAMETGGDLASLALLEGLDVVAESAFRHRMTLSRDLMPAIDELLARSETTWDHVEAVAVGLGPGSFTGLRIGVVTAKSLAWASGRPVLGIPSLAALAAPQLAPPETLLCAVLEARADEFFTALYQRRDGALHVRAEPTVLAASELEARLRAYPGPVLVAGHAARWARALAATLEAGPFTEASEGPARATGFLALTRFDEEPQARWIGRLAADRLAAGDQDDPAGLVPLYVRSSTPEVRLQARTV